MPTGSRLTCPSFSQLWFFFFPSFVAPFFSSFFLSSFFCSFLPFSPPSLLFLLPSFLPSFLSSFLHSFIPSFLHFFHLSIFLSFLPSFLLLFLPSFLPSFHCSIIPFFSFFFIFFFALSSRLFLSMFPLSSIKLWLSPFWGVWDRWSENLSPPPGIWRSLILEGIPEGEKVELWLCSCYVRVWEPLPSNPYNQRPEKPPQDYCMFYNLGSRDQNDYN